MEPIHIFYYGGTGGHYALWLAILGAEYRTSFFNIPYNENVDFDHLYDVHWNKASMEKWAHQELKCDPKLCEQMTIPNRATLTCGASSPTTKLWNNPHGKRIVIYTDLLMQMTMAVEKQTSIGLFANDTSRPHTIAKEMMEYIPAMQYKDKTIASWYDLVVNINDADLAVDLKDLIKYNGDPLLEFLGVEPNERVKKFTADYLKMHSTKTRNMLRK